MYNKLLLLAALVLIPTSYVQAQCSNGTCSVNYGSSVNYGNCGSYYSGPVYYYSRPSVVYAESLHMHLRNIPGGNEKSRFYVSIFVEEDNYTANIPVINGYLPDVTLHRNSRGKVSDIVLDYSEARKYNNSYGSSDGYIHYSDPNKKKPTAVKLEETPRPVKRNEVPSAVKNEEVTSRVSNPETILPMPQRSLIRPSDSEIDDLFKKKTVNPEPISPPSVNSGVKNPSDAEIESLLKRPSSVGSDGGSPFPNYDR